MNLPRATMSAAFALASVTAFAADCPAHRATRRGHLTTGNAKFYKKQLEEFLQSAPQRAM